MDILLKRVQYILTNLERKCSLLPKALLVLSTVLFSYTGVTHESLECRLFPVAYLWGGAFNPHRSYDSMCAKCYI